MITNNKILTALSDIEKQASRHRRAVSKKVFLLNDLEIIERKAKKAMALLKAPEEDAKENYTFYELVKLIREDFTTHNPWGLDDGTQGAILVLTLLKSIGVLNLKEDDSNND